MAEHLAGKAAGILSRLTMKGASLQTSTILLEGYHLLLNNSQEGKTPLVLELPPLPEAAPWTLKAQILGITGLAARDRDSSSKSA